MQKGYLESQVIEPVIVRHLIGHRIVIAKQTWSLIDIRMLYFICFGNLLETIADSCHTIFFFVSMLLRACTVHMGNATEMHWDRDFVLCPEHCANKQWVWPSSEKKGSTLLVTE